MKGSYSNSMVVLVGICPFLRVLYPIIVNFELFGTSRPGKNRLYPLEALVFYPWQAIFPIANSM